MDKCEYWEETVSIAADECGAVLTKEQIQCIAGAVEVSHENYGMAYYQPPVTDRIADVEREWKLKTAKLEREFEHYKGLAENALKTALHQYQDSRVFIDTEDGAVYRSDGRVTRIQ